MSAAISVPKVFSFAGTPVFFDVSTSTTPGVEQSLLSLTVPSGIVRNLYQAIIVCRMESMFTISIDGQTVGSGRTGAAMPNVAFSFNPPRPISAGSILEIKLQARSGSPAVSVEAFVQAADEEV